MTIGGLFGPVLQVNNLVQLLKECNSVGPKTIVVNANIDSKSTFQPRIRDYKTIVGSFKYHTIYDCDFRTNNRDGDPNDNPSDNIIFRNLNLEAKNEPNRILINIWSSRQIWFDHITFNSTLNYDRKGDGQDDVGKFIWLNTPYENYKDKKDRLRSIDYITISYCKFTNRFWTVAYGTQNDEYTRDRTTLLYNWWNKNVRRCPQLGNGSAHIYNNYYEAYGQKDNGGSTTGIIGGDNSEMLSQNNMFNGFTKEQALTMGGDTLNPARDDNSYFSGDLNGTPTKINFSAKKKSNWNPNKSNYSYRLLDGYNNKKTDTKTFCTKYAGCFNSQNDIKYITDSDFSSWTSTIYGSPFLTHIDFSDAAEGGEDIEPIPSGLSNNSTWRIKNVNSNLYMQVEGAKKENGTNIQQWGTTEDSIHDIWKLVDAGNGYYYIISQIGDGNTYYLNIAGNSKEDGANVEIYESNGKDSQKFMITENQDGSYVIKTKITNNESVVEVSNYGKSSGDNVQQWTLTGHESQSWIFESVPNPHSKLYSKNTKNVELLKETIIKTNIYKEKDCVHTVIFVK